MIRLTRWWIALVFLVILGSLFVDGFGAGYQIYAAGRTDPHIGCDDLSLRAKGLQTETGTFTVLGVDGADKDKEIKPRIIDAASLTPSWSSAWKYNVAKGGGQQIAQVSSHQLANAAATAGLVSVADGYHLAVSIGSGGQDKKSFWITCKSTVALPATPSPSPAASPSASATTSPAATPTATPKPSPSPSASPSPSPSASPAAPVATGGGSFWVDSIGAPKLFGSVSAIPLKRGLDLVGGSELTIVICHGNNDPVGSTCRNGLKAGADYAQARNDTIPIIQQRVNGLGVAEASVEPEGNDRIIVQIPGVDLTEAQTVIGTTAKLHFATAKLGAIDPAVCANPDLAAKDPSITVDQHNLVDCNEVTNSSKYPTGYHWVIDDNLQATNVTAATQTYDQNSQPAVAISFDSKGADEWSKITTTAFAAIQAQGKGSPENRVAIFLDGKVLTAPEVTEPSAGNTQISGNLTVQDAIDLANHVNAGALPADISTIQSTSVSATLGAQTVRQSLIAGGIGLIIVVLFMIGYYRFPGLLASVALGFYSIVALAVFKLFGVTLTLPGLAGFVLSVGMAVDANVLIFERTRDELRHGRPVGIAVETGFRRAFPAIKDSNISTGIACLILYMFGSGVIRGFAVTLGLGVAVSFFSAILVTQALFAWSLRRKFGRNARLYTQIHEEYVDNPPKGRFDIVKSRNLFFAASLVIIIPGILAITFWGFRLGLDFAGGNKIDAHLKNNTTISEVQATVDAVASDIRPQIQAQADNHYAIRTLPAPINRVQQISDALDKKFGFVTDAKTNRPDVQVDTIGPTIASELVRGAVFLVLFASFAIAIYLAVVFGHQRQISRWRFAACTLFKLLHDVFVLLGLWAIFGKFSDLGQVDSLFVTAVLTSVAFSIHDTIVVFDRVRENLRFGPRLTFDQVINLSTVQTMTRSLNTALTVVFVLLSLVLFGGSSIRGFVLALLIGIITGTYSSIFNASTLLVAWKEWDVIRMPAERGSKKAKPAPSA